MSEYLQIMQGILAAWERAERLPPCEHCGEERRAGFKHYCVVAFMESEQSLTEAKT